MTPEELEGVLTACLSALASWKPATPDDPDPTVLINGEAVVLSDAARRLLPHRDAMTPELQTRLNWRRDSGGRPLRTYDQGARQIIRIIAARRLQARVDEARARLAAAL
jgi:hypothetical protein